MNILTTDKHRYTRMAVGQASCLSIADWKSTALHPGLPLGIRATTLKFRVRATKIWSAVTRHRFGCLGDWSPKQGRVQRPGVKPGRTIWHSTATSRLRKARTSPRTPKRLHRGVRRVLAAFARRLVAVERQEGNSRRMPRALNARWPGDQSPGGQSADQSAHSKAAAASPRWVHSCSFVSIRV